MRPINRQPRRLHRSPHLQEVVPGVLFSANLKASSWLMAQLLRGSQLAWLLETEQP
jgi:hypothetical protein